MKNSSLITLAALILAASLANYSCTTETQSKDLAEEDSTAAIPVETAVAQRGSISAYYATTATLEAEEEAMVVAKVRGMATGLKAEEGDYVEAGQVLATLEDEQLQIEADRAKADMDRLYNDYRRNAELFEKKLISQEAYENSKFEYESQKASWELARLNIEHTTIRAPISGVVSERTLKVGNRVNADQQVFRITDFDPLLAVLHVPEHEMSKLQRRQTALLQADAVPGASFRGEVLRIAPVVNAETGTFKVTVAVRDASGRLKPGMFGRVRIVYDTHAEALLLPKNALLNEDGVSSVYLVSNGMALRREVQTGYVNGNNVEILGGLGEGDTVVTVGQSSLQDSVQVDVVSFN